MTLGCIGWITAVKGHFFFRSPDRQFVRYVGGNRYALTPLGSLRRIPLLRFSPEPGLAIRGRQCRRTIRALCWRYSLHVNFARFVM